MADLFDYEAIIRGWVDENAPSHELPLSCFYLTPEPVRCDTLTGIADCFMTFLQQNNFEEALAENPSAITRLDTHFDVFAEDHLFAVGDE